MEGILVASLYWLQLLFFTAVLITLIPLVGSYMAAVFQGRCTFLRSIENIGYRLCGINPQEGMHWLSYLKALLFFNLICFLFLFILQLAQGILPLNPQNFPGIPWPLAFNTAASFVTNTNWQSYSGETTLSYFTQMVGLAVQNFMSAATGMCVLLAFIRGIANKVQETLGNFWVDLVRCTLYIMLPISILFAFVLVGQGVVQTFAPYVEVTTVEGAKQTIPLGPAASQIAIKQLGTNGGGFFNANSAHPFENPTALANFLETLALVLIPAASVWMYGIMIGKRGHGLLLLGVMFVLWGGGLVASLYSETIPDPVLGTQVVLEGKESRFGITQSLLWAMTTTSTANGSVNCMHSSLSPLAGGLTMFNIMLGELVFGGVGVGLASMLMFSLLTVFLSGLMVGRTPEYFGKKIEKREMQWITVSILAPGALILIGSSLALMTPSALSSLANSGPHGLSEILYAFTSCAGNNGSAFAGLNANTNFYNLSLGVVMILARLAIVVPSIAVAGLIVRKKVAPATAGTFSTESLLFAILLVSVILIVGALTFFPALSLGPIVEHFLMLRGQSV
jgi:K+-transporting ATPase ATPase A chain